MSKQAGQLVAMTFLARDLAHRAHLQTDSYAEHMALGEFYEGVIPLVDSFAEAFQGRYNERLDIPLMDNEFEGEIADVLEQQMAWIEDNREKVCPRSESALHNEIDAIVHIYQTTMYKLRFLA
jgi:hypothetical protein